MKSMLCLFLLAIVLPQSTFAASLYNQTQNNGPGVMSSNGVSSSNGNSNIGNSAAAIASTTIQAPCTITGQPGLRACADLINGVPGKPGIITQVTTALKQQVACYYQGVELDVLAASNPANANACTGGPSGKYCSIIPSSLYEPVSENTNDHLGNSCGNMMQIKIDVVRHYSGPPSTRCQQGHGCTVAHYTVNQPNGEYERSHIRGTYIQALDFYSNQVLGNLKCSQTLTVAPIGNAPNPCAALAADVANLSNMSKQVVDGIKQQLGTQANVADVVNCEKLATSGAQSNLITSVDPTTVLDTGPARQSAQQLCAMRSNLESAYTQLVTCNILAQAQFSFLSKTGSSDQMLAWMNTIGDQIDQLCHPTCKGSGSTGEATSCANNCYRQQMQGGFLQSQFAPLWPQTTMPNCPIPPNVAPPVNTPVAAPGLPPGGSARGDFTPLLIGSLLIAGRRKRRSDRILKAIRAAAGIAAIAVALSFTGCGGAGNTPVTQALDNNGQCPANGSQLFADCCAPGTNTLLPSAQLPSHCFSTAPGGPRIGNTLTQAGNAAAGAETGYNNANSMLGKGAGPQLAAATAGGSSGLSNLGNSNAPNTGTATSAGQTAGGGGGGAGANRGANGSSAAGLGDVSTGAEPPSTDPGSVDPNSAAALYASASGGAAGGGKGGSGTDLSAMLAGFNGGGIPGQGGDQNFGQRNVAAMSGADPDDYFTRLGLQDNIFKIVERRYTAKSLQWQQVSLSSGSAVVGTRTLAGSTPK